MNLHEDTSQFAGIAFVIALLLGALLAAMGLIDMDDWDMFLH